MLQEKPSSAGVHLRFVDPLKFARFRVKCAMLQAHELQGEAWPKLLKSGFHLGLLIFLTSQLLLLLLKNVAMMPASRALVS